MTFIVESSFKSLERIAAAGCRNKPRYRLPPKLIAILTLLLTALAAGLSPALAGSAKSGAQKSALPGKPAPSILVGLDAAMTGSVGQSGKAIERGLRLAIKEINASGGVLGRSFELVIRNNRGTPARGIDNIEELAELDNLVAVVGGIHTPVALAQLETIHRRKVIYLGAWAAGTPIVDNGFAPNYVFRVSARDEYAGGFLIGEAIKRGFRRPGLLLWRTGWGRSNEKAMKAAIKEHDIELAGIAWFNTSQPDMTPQIRALADAGADVIMLVANAAEGLTIVRNMAEFDEGDRLPIISHWGITGGDIVSADPAAFDRVDLSILQTYSFFDPPFPDKAKRFMAAYCEAYAACGSPAMIASPVGAAHAYDIAYLLMHAIEKAGTTDRVKVRAALETLERYEGLVRVYDPPFTAGRHDALDAADFRLCRYDQTGAIIPLSGGRVN